MSKKRIPRKLKKAAKQMYFVYIPGFPDSWAIACRGRSHKRKRKIAEKVAKEHAEAIRKVEEAYLRTFTDRIKDYAKTNKTEN